MNFKFSEIKKYCINLERSVNRKLAAQAEFDKFGIEVEFFKAIDKHEIVLPELSIKKHETEALGKYACAMSHIAVIRKAKELNLPAVCIFEDDVVFCDDFRERIKYIEALPNFSFDVFSLGGHFSTKTMTNEDAESTQWQHILKTKRHGGTYALIVSANVYDFILRNHTYNYGADQFYGDQVYHRFKSYAFVPFLVGCAGGVSDITDSNFGYENVGWYYQQEAFLKRTFKDKEVLPKKQMEIPKLASRDLMDCTFIIPVRIESDDRKFNFMRVIEYLCKNFDANIIIKENDVDSKVMHLLKFIDPKGCKITHLLELNDNSTFHRTRLLNEMISMVKTPVTINYDIDVLMKPDAYINARDRITKEGYDLIYPYGKGMTQVQIKFPNKERYQGEDLFHSSYCSEWGSLAGHVQFFNTKSYIEGFMENEEFLSYGAEDRERMNRFQTLGYKVDWCDGFQVWHMEHSRGDNSAPSNPHFGQNEALYYALINMSRAELENYYNNKEYIKKYR